LLKFVAMGILAPLAASCSLGLPERQECSADSECTEAFGPGHSCGSGGFCEGPGACSDNSECRERLGFGYVCGEDRACEFVTPNPRCTRTLPERLFQPDEFKDAIVFGSIVERNFDGDAVLEHAAELAVSEANDGDGLDGRPIGMVFCTDEANPEYDSLTPDDGESDVAVAEFLVDALGVQAIFGPTTSGRTEAVFEAIRDSAPVLITPSATSPGLTALDNATPTDDDPGLLWRTVPPDSLQGQTMALDMRDRGVESVAVIVETGTYGDGLAAVFATAFTEMGGTIEGEILSFATPSAMSSAIVTAGNSDATEVLFISGLIEDERSFLNAAGSQPGYDTKSIFLSDTAATLDLFVDTPEELFPRIRLTRPAVGSGSIYDLFIAAYSSRYPGENPRQFGFIAQAYDAAWMILYGAAWANAQDESVTGVGIARGLRRLSEGAEVPVRGSSWTTVLGAFREGSSIDIVGASGALDYSPETEETEAGIEVVAVAECEGEWLFVLVEPGDPPACS
jgi:branched-chain amino acid transport system substrate-binding protein